MEGVRILIIGLENTGKTTILYKLHVGEVVTTIPTLGFNVETVEYRNINFTVWDVGGQSLLRPMWKGYYVNTPSLIFLVDSSDRERVAEARKELHAALAAGELMRGAALLVLANKQDVEGAMGVVEVTDKLGLKGVESGGRRWHVQGACAMSGEGLYQGLEWLSTNVTLDN